MPSIELLFVALAAFLLLSIVGSKAATKTGVPVLLLFLALGMLAGSDGPGGFYFDNPWLSQSVGVVALAFILFSGGLNTPWNDVRPVLKQGLALSTLGVTLTALCVGWFAATFLGFTLAEGVLLGAIIASTDAAAVFAVLNSQSVRLKGRLKELLELESGSNDPMAVFLTIGMLQLIANPGQSPLTLIPMFVLQMGLGALIGVAIGKGAVLVINRLRLEYDGLYPVLSFALVLVTYGATALVGGNGFLAVYLAGLVMAQQDFVHKRSLTQFHDGLAWLMQIVMFVTLGLQVFPSRLPDVALGGLFVALFLIFLARPLSVFLALAPTSLSLREKVFVSWVGLRGAAPIVLATFPLLAGVAKADTIFHLVFFIVLTSVLLQGTLIIPMAKWLKVYDTTPPRLSPLAYVMRDRTIANDLAEIHVAPSAPAAGKQVVDLHLPPDVLIVLIGRGGDMIVPRGGTVIEPDDTLLVMAPQSSNEHVYELLGKPV
jgi:cell volume regulation protein A